jgi:hypothetical protein
MLVLQLYMGSPEATSSERPRSPACAYEGALSFVTRISCNYRDSPYKRECGRKNDRRPSSKPACWNWTLAVCMNARDVCCFSSLPSAAPARFRRIGWRSAQAAAEGAIAAAQIFPLTLPVSRNPGVSTHVVSDVKFISWPCQRRGAREGEGGGEGARTGDGVYERRLC